MMAKTSLILVLLACSVFNAGGSILDDDDPFGMESVVRYVKIGIGMGYRTYNELTKPESIDQIAAQLTKVTRVSNDKKSSDIFDQIIDKATKTMKDVNGAPITDREVNEILEKFKSAYSHVTTKTTKYLKLLGGNKYISKSYKKKLAHMGREFKKAFMKSADLPIDPMFALKILRGMHSSSNDNGKTSVAPVKVSTPTTTAPKSEATSTSPKSDSDMGATFNKFLVGMKPVPSTNNAEKKHDDGSEGLFKHISNIFGGSSLGLDLKPLLENQQLHEMLQGLMGN